jgi:membrane-bound lytic murein transglycosylase D
VARKYGVTADAIRETNDLGKTTPKAGQTLIIPVSQARLAYAPPERQVASRSAKRSGGKVRVTHRVRKGETLYSIANRYNVYVKQLRAWNFLDKNDVLRTGQKLKIYTRKRQHASLDGEHLG